MQENIVDFLYVARKRIKVLVAMALVGFSFFFYLSEQIIRRVKVDLLPHDAVQEMRIPVEDVLGPDNGYYIIKVGPKLVQTTPMEYVMVKVQMALVLGVMAVLPIFAFYVLMKLGRVPRFSFLPWLAAAAVLFLGGAALTYLVLLPAAIGVLTGFATDAGVSTFFSINKFILFTVVSVILFALVFELPLAVTWLTVHGVVSVEALKEKRKHVWVGIFILTALITADPTPISQVILSLPVIVLYELSIVSSRFLGRKRTIS